MTVEQAVIELEAANWPMVAEDLREGTPPATILSRLNKLAWEEGEDGHADDGYDEAIAIVASITYATL